MKIRFSVFILIVFTLSTEVTAQRNVFGLSAEPVFRTTQDSVNFYVTDQRLREVMVLGNVKRAIIDSLVRVRSEIQLKGIRGYRYIYYPNDTFIQYEDLEAGEIDPEEVTQLSVSGYYGKTLPTKIFACKNLEELELIDTRLEELPRQLNELTRLRAIRICNNRPTRKLKLKKNSHITYLQIRGDKPEMLPSSYRKFKALDSLDLSRNMLDDFPNTKRNQHLKQLMLTDNNLTLDKLKPNTTIENLFLHKNKITSVPASIGKFTNLKKIVFSYNNIATVSPAIGELKKLEHLSFYQNKLTTIPEGVYQLKTLKSIDLYFNELEKIDEHLGDLKNLEILYLSNNKIRTLPPGVGELTALRELYLHHNQLSELPNLQNLSRLKVLRVNENFLIDFPAEILTLKQLENLDLSRNEFRELPASILQLENLKLIGITDNPWENTDQVSAIVKSLEKRGVMVQVNSMEP